MQATVEIGGRELALTANGATPYVYKRVFRSDLFHALTRFMEELQKGGIDPENMMEDGGAAVAKGDMVTAFGAAVESAMTEFPERLCFVMAMQGEKSTPQCMNLTEGDFVEWMASFPPNAMMGAAGEILGVYLSQANGTSALKKSPVPSNVR